jgi:hypothetical protein
MAAILRGSILEREREREREVIFFVRSGYVIRPIFYFETCGEDVILSRCANRR